MAISNITTIIIIFVVVIVVVVVVVVLVLSTAMTTFVTRMSELVVHELKLCTTVVHSLCCRPSPCVRCLSRLLFSISLWVSF